MDYQDTDEIELFDVFSSGDGIGRTLQKRTHGTIQGELPNSIGIHKGLKTRKVRKSRGEIRHKEIRKTQRRKKQRIEVVSQLDNIKYDTHSENTQTSEDVHRLFSMFIERNLIDANEAKQVANIITFCETHFSRCNKGLYERYIKKLLYILAVRTVSISQASTLLQADTGILSPQMNGFKGRRTVDIKSNLQKEE